MTFTIVWRYTHDQAVALLVLPACYSCTSIFCKFAFIARDRIWYTASTALTVFLNGQVNNDVYTYAFPGGFVHVPDICH